MTSAVLVLACIVLYKLGDNLASHMSIPFYLQIGFTNAEIGAIVKGFGLGALLLGLFAGGACALQLGLYRAMLLVGVLQGVSTAGFALLAVIGAECVWLAAVIGFENLTAGMGTAALIAFIASLTSRRFTATQFALLSTLAAVPRTLLSAPSGLLAEALGWVWFFTGCALLAVPGLLLLPLVRQWFSDAPGAAAATVPAPTTSG